MKLSPKQNEARAKLSGDAPHVLLVGGARSGKTFIIVRNIVLRAQKAAGSRHLIARFRYNAVRQSVWHDTFPKVMSLCFPGVAVRPNKADGYVVFPNGSEIWFAGLDEKERTEKILGQEYASFFANECSQIPYSSIMLLRTRLAQKAVDAKGTPLLPRAYYDLNPTGTAHWTHKIFFEKRDPETLLELREPGKYDALYMNPYDNLENLPQGYIDELASLPERQRQRFLLGKYVSEIEGALWTLETIEKSRRSVGQVILGRANDIRQLMQRVVVAVDPSGTSGVEDKRSSEIGIVVAGIGFDGVGYVLEDATLNASPEKWGQQVIAMFDKWLADRVVAETNYGGDMVRFTVQTARRSVPVRIVTASRGKHVRAEPVSVLYEQGRVVHVLDDSKIPGGDPTQYRRLEDQMLNFSTAGYLGDKSPDRADACIAAGSLVTTQAGDAPIETVTPGTMVLTRAGWRRVLAARETRKSAVVMTARTTAGAVTATPDHRVFTENRGWLRLDALVCGDIMLSCRRIRQSQSCSTALSLPGSRDRGAGQVGFTTPLSRTAAALRASASFMSRSGKRQTASAVFQLGASSTTPISIRSIIRQIICFALPAKNTRSFMPKTTKIRSMRKPWRASAILRRLGTPAMRDELGTRATPSTCGRAASIGRLLASNAATLLFHSSPARLGFARVGAADALQTPRTDMSSRLNANVGRCSGKANIASSLSLVPARVLGLSVVDEPKSVYDLMIDGEHEFFADGHLVHNCVWALTELMVKKDKPKPAPSPAAIPIFAR